MNLRGHLDSVTSSGFAEGWAFNADQPLRQLLISVTRKGNEIAYGLAHLYREDLAEAGCGTGWCAFRVRLSVPVKTARAAPLNLVDRQSGVLIHTQPQPNALTDTPGDIKSVEQLVASDPTLVGPLARLGGCNPIFNQFIQRKGVEMFVRAAYVYVLSRPADADGIANYTHLLQQSAIEPIGLLALLADSDEFRARPRALGAPNSPAFPFQLDA